MIDLEPIKAHTEALLEVPTQPRHWPTIRAIAREDVPALIAEVERLRAGQHATSRADRQAGRTVIAELLKAHDEAQQRDGVENHEGNRYETAGLIYSAFDVSGSSTPQPTSQEGQS